MRRVYRAHEILDISVDADGDMTVDWSFRFRDTPPDQSPVSTMRVNEELSVLFGGSLVSWCTFFFMFLVLYLAPPPPWRYTHMSRFVHCYFFLRTYFPSSFRRLHNVQS